VTPVGFPAQIRKIYPDSRIVDICAKLGLPQPPTVFQFIVGMFLDIHQNLALVSVLLFVNYLQRFNIVAKLLVTTTTTYFQLMFSRHKVQGSVATHLKRGAICSDSVITIFF